MKSKLIVPTSDCGDQFIREPKVLDECHLFKTLEANDQRIRELESIVLDLQSELSRKKMSLTVACNRVEELEEKLVKCQEIAIRLGIKYNEGEWSETDHARNALEKIGELK